MSLAKHLSIFFILFYLNAFCYAQPQPLEDFIAEELSLEGLYDLPFVDIATGYAVPLEKAPSVASVITAEDIKAMGAITIDDVLESVPGIHVQPSELSSSLEVSSIRGVYTGRGPQVLILLNGYRISSDISSGTFPDGAKISVQNIARIEVIRGPGSAIYGADAFSGVINIITKNAREIDGFNVGLRGGSFNSKNLWAQYGGDLGGGWRLAANLEYLKQDADTSRMVNSDAQTGLDALFGTNASLAPSYLDRRFETTSYNFHLDDGYWKFGLDGWHNRNLGSGTGFAHTIDHKGSTDIDHYLLSLEYRTKTWHEHLDFSSKLSYQYIDQQYNIYLFPPGNISLIGSDGNLFTAPFNPVSFPDGVIGNPARTSKITQADMTFLYSGIKNHVWRFNFGLIFENFSANATKNFGTGVIDGSEGVVDGTLTETTGTPFIYLPNEKRNVKYLSLQNVWEINPDWTLTTGIRHDYYSDFGGTTNPRLALVWTITDSFISKFLYGRAFRAPSIADLYAQNNPVTLGNPKLEPETTDTFELAFGYELMHNFNANLNLFYYQTHDMIEFIPIGQEGNIAENYYSLSGRGFEIEFDWKVNKQWHLQGSYSFQKSINDETDQQHPFVPKRQLYLDIRWSFLPNWLLSGQLNWVADRHRRFDDTRKKIDDYTLFNLNLRRSNIAKHWEVSASIKNLFDEDAREISNAAIADDYPLNERSVFLELNYQY